MMPPAAAADSAGGSFSVGAMPELDRNASQTSGSARRAFQPGRAALDSVEGVEVRAPAMAGVRGTVAGWPAPHVSLLVPSPRRACVLQRSGDSAVGSPGGPSSMLPTFFMPGGDAMEGAQSMARDHPQVRAGDRLGASQHAAVLRFASSDVGLWGAKPCARLPPVLCVRRSPFCLPTSSRSLP